LDRSLGELLVDNGNRTGRFASTPLNIPLVARFESWAIQGGARVFTDAGVRVVNGDAGYFAGLISSNYLQVGGLLVSNTWVYGDVMDLVISRQESGVENQHAARALVTVYCRPLKTYLLLASTNFLDWIPVATNTPTGSRFDYLDTLGSADGSSASQRFFRAVMLEHLYDSLGLSLNPTNRQARLSISNAQPAHTLIISASDDLRYWTPLATNAFGAVTNWQFLDTNAPAFPQRFYRAWGQGK
jgi:hypothetical protein